MLDDLRNKKIIKIENYIDFLEKNSRKIGAIIADIQIVTKQEFKKAYEICDYQYFMTAGDYHYFVSRILFLTGMGIYAFFSAHQCIENYLKAYLKYTGEKSVLEKRHNLMNLLSLAKKKSTRGSFLRSSRCEIILRKYFPFYEIPRYPVQHSRPKNGHYAFMHPDDIHLLDYFIYEMRKITPLPKGTWNLFEKGIPYEAHLIKDYAPELVKIFKRKNINFN